MNSSTLVKKWFDGWRRGDFLNLPIANDFKHTSPFGTIVGKKNYLELVAQNKEKFLGYTFKIHEALYDVQKTCVRYTAKQGEGFSLEVSEWFYIQNNLIEEVIAYYHIGALREERKLKGIESKKG